jgi:hypothetical protein
MHSSKLHVNPAPKGQMRKVIFLILISIGFSCFAQVDSTSSITFGHLDGSTPDSSDSKSMFLLKAPGPTQIIVSKENIVYYSSSPVASLTEKEIADLESRECTALKKRDELTLSRLWLRDFSLDKKQNEIVTGNSSLANYLSLSRVIEKITVINPDLVYTSGYESFQELTNSPKLQPRARRTFFHSWKRENGVWKLTSKMLE